MLGVYKGATHPLDNAAIAARDLANNILPIPFTNTSENPAGKTVPLGDWIDAASKMLGLSSPEDIKAAHENYIAGQEEKDVVPGAAGEIAGSILGTIPAIAVTKSPFIGGALAGAMDTTHDTASGVAQDALLGGVLGKVGDTAVRGASRLIAPKVSNAVRTLVDEGIPLTPGRILGGIPKRVEDSLQSIPIMGDRINAAQRNSLGGFSRAAVNRVLKPINESLPDNIATGHDAVAYAGDRLSNAYDTLLPKLTLKADPTFAREFNNLRQLSQNIPQYGVKPLDDFVQTNIMPRISKAGMMTGESYKEVDSMLRREAASYGASQNPNDRKLGGAFRELQAQMRRALERSNPQYAPSLKQIDRGWANLTRVERASAYGAKDGVFSPPQLNTAVRTTDASVRKRAVSRGKALMQDLSSAGSSVLPQSVPDSGTAGRYLMTKMALGGGLLYGNEKGYIPPETLALGLLTLGAYSKPGQKALTGLLARNPSVAEQKLADLVSQLRAPSLLLGPALVAQQRTNVDAP